MLSHKKSVWITSGVFIFTLISSSAVVNAQAPLKDPAERELSKLQWKVIDGFRSAKFGMDEKQLLRAISKDFRIPKTKIKNLTNPIEKITALEVTVPKLLAFGGPARVQYILGYKSKKLVNVSVLWGEGVAKKVDANGIVDAANFLKNHFLKKQYVKGKTIVGQRMNDAEMLIFRGFDKKKRAIVLVLRAPATNKGIDPENLKQEFRLKLQYLRNPFAPDVFRPSIEELPK